MYVYLSVSVHVGSDSEIVERSRSFADKLAVQTVKQSPYILLGAQETGVGALEIPLLRARALQKWRRRTLAIKPSSKPCLGRKLRKWAWTRMVQNQCWTQNILSQTHPKRSGYGLDPVEPAGFG